MCSFGKKRMQRFYWWLIEQICNMNRMGCRTTLGKLARHYKLERDGETANPLCNVNTAAAWASLIIFCRDSGSSNPFGFRTNDASTDATSVSPAPVTFTIDSGGRRFAGKWCITTISPFPLPVDTIRRLWMLLLSDAHLAWRETRMTTTTPRSPHLIIKCWKNGRRLMAI